MIGICKAYGCHRLNRYAVPVFETLQIDPTIWLWTDDKSFCTARCARNDRLRALICLRDGCNKLTMKAIPRHDYLDRGALAFDHKIYCSQKCATIDEDSKCLRNFKRLVQFLNDLSINVNIAATTLRLEGEEETEHELKLHISWQSDPEELYYNATATSVKGRHAMLSHNMCDTFVASYAGVLSFLWEALQIPIIVKEVHIRGVVAAQRVLLIEHGREPSHVAPVHTMFRVKMDNLVLQGSFTLLKELLEDCGVYIDATAHQYGRGAGYILVSRYPTDPSNQVPPDVAIIGTTYEARLGRICESHSTSPQPFPGDFFNEVITRNVNNTFHHEFSRLGRAAMFSEFDSVSHEAAKRMITGSIMRKVRGARDFLFSLWLDSEEGMMAGELKAILQEDEGYGDSEILASLQRKSGLRF
ncbi:hypothetical protein FB567DRAFT_598279 [Paraphoma chrysanthemicola]|uniref:Uncharacterized protein n=1 Tax=Paraphoma chrysanthemicola TaxID=798071 RepID=A0A8K0VTA6_9PLEO|nr:hypothetical protein FB567DRAFT_598279 [Paraphoma chrysanthemicola]